MSDFYECNKRDEIVYPADCVHPPHLYKYPRPHGPISLLFLGWNPPKPYGGFWSLQFDDDLRTNLHRILMTLEKIASPYPDQKFFNEFLSKGYYFLHTVKCWSQAKFPGFGRDSGTPKLQERKAQVGLPLLHACVRTHLADELESLGPQKVCALGKLSFLGLSVLYPGLGEEQTFPTEGRVFPKGACGLPWPLLYSCFPQRNSVPIKGIKQRKKGWEILGEHLRDFL